MSAELRLSGAAGGVPLVPFLIGVEVTGWLETTNRRGPQLFLQEVLYGCGHPAKENEMECASMSERFRLLSKRVSKPVRRTVLSV